MNREEIRDLLKMFGLSSRGTKYELKTRLAPQITKAPKARAEKEMLRKCLSHSPVAQNCHVSELAQNCHVSEFARLVHVLTEEDSRQALLNLFQIYDCKYLNAGPDRDSFWKTHVQNTFNNKQYKPTNPRSIPSELTFTRPDLPPLVFRKGTVLKKRFQRTCFDFAQDYEVWQRSGQQNPDSFKTFTKSSRTYPDSLRKQYLFALLRCGTPEVDKEFLEAVLRLGPEWQSRKRTRVETIGQERNPKQEGVPLLRRRRRRPTCIGFNIENDYTPDASILPQKVETLDAGESDRLARRKLELDCVKSLQVILANLTSKNEPGTEAMINAAKKEMETLLLG